MYQNTVARELGVCESAVLNWENNQSMPAIRIIPRIIKFLGYVPNEISSSPTLGKKVLAYRKRHGLSQKKLAWRLGLDEGTIRRLERGQGRPGRRVTKAIESLLSL
jgi:transcriptional regulator with XRE-family HTH domain